MSRLLAFSLAVILLAPAASRAEDPKPAAAAATAAPSPATPAAAPAAPPAPKWWETIEIHGLVDTYYQASFTQAQDYPNQVRVFDAGNGFQLAYSKLTAQMAPAPVGFRLDVGYGPVAGILNGNAPTYSAAYQSASKPYSQVTVQQAFASAKFGEVVFDLGRFNTPIGAEVIEAKDNWLYSRSILFGWAIPFTHTGVRATIGLPVEGLSVVAGLVNGWDNPPGPVGAPKTGLLSLVYNGPSSTLLAVNASYGGQPGLTENQGLIDVVLQRAFGDFALNLNGDFGWLGSVGQWYGVSLMARYSFLGDKLRVTARGEWFRDPDGVRTGVVNGTFFEATGGVSVPIASNFEARAELRYDNCSQDIFAGDAGFPKNHNFTGTIAALAWF